MEIKFTFLKMGESQYYLVIDKKNKYFLLEVMSLVLLKVAIINYTEVQIYAR